MDGCRSPLCGEGVHPEESLISVMGNGTVSGCDRRKVREYLRKPCPETEGRSVLSAVDQRRHGWAVPLYRVTVGFRWSEHRTPRRLGQGRGAIGSLHGQRCWRAWCSIRSWSRLPSGRSAELTVRAMAPPHVVFHPSPARQGQSLRPTGGEEKFGQRPGECVSPFEVRPTGQLLRCAVGVSPCDAVASTSGSTAGSLGETLD